VYPPLFTNRGTAGRVVSHSGRSRAVRVMVAGLGRRVQRYVARRQSRLNLTMLRGRTVTTDRRRAGNPNTAVYGSVPYGRFNTMAVEATIRRLRRVLRN